MKTIRFAIVPVLLAMTLWSCSPEWQKRQIERDLARIHAQEAERKAALKKSQAPYNKTQAQFEACFRQCDDAISDICSVHRCAIDQRGDVSAQWTNRNAAWQVVWAERLEAVGRDIAERDQRLTGEQDEWQQPQLAMAWQPGRRQITYADYGPPPADHGRMVLNWFARHLPDPYSAEYGRVTKPRRSYVVKDPLKKRAVYGYVVCAAVNSKNSHGAYIGIRDYRFMIRGNTIADVADATGKCG